MAAAQELNQNARLIGPDWVFVSLSGDAKANALDDGKYKTRMHFKINPNDGGLVMGSPVNHGHGTCAHVSLTAGQWGAGVCVLEGGAWTERGSADNDAQYGETTIQQLHGTFMWSVKPQGGSWEAKDDYMILVLKPITDRGANWPVSARADDSKAVWTFRSREPTFCKPLKQQDDVAGELPAGGPGAGAGKGGAAAGGIGAKPPAAGGGGGGGALKQQQ